MTYFPYGETETSYLRGRDKLLGEAIDRIGPLKRELRPDLFSALCHSIIGQQISSAAQATVWGRMMEALGERGGQLSPRRVAGRTVEELQRFGISMRKAGYLHTAALRVVDGELDLEKLGFLPDEEVCRRLTALPGVGLWTAQMLLIFSLARPDVVSYGDYGIRKGMRMLYCHETLTKEQFLRYQKRYSPYGTTASLYLWAVAGGG